MNINDRELLARTLQAEAGNQGYGGMLAAGSVIMNRVNTSGYGNGLRGVILKPGQFSAWNSTTGYAGGEQGQDMANMRASDEAYKAADALISGGYKDVTGGATHYYNPAISQPTWGQKDGDDWKQIGDHVFGFADAGRKPNPNQAIASDTMRVLGKQPKGLLASNTMNTTESEMVPEQKPKGLLGGLFSDPDKRARLAMALEGMTLNPNQGMMASLQGGIDQRGEDRKEAAAEAKKLAQRNKSMELLAGLPGGEEFIRIAEIAGPKAGVQAYLESRKAPKSTSAQDQINRLMSTGVSEEVAIGIVDGRIVVSRDPVTGEATLVDKAQLSAQKPSPVVATEDGPPPQGGGLFEGTNPVGALGASGLGAGFINTISDAIGAGQPADKIAKASSALNSLSVRTSMGLTAEFPGRPSNLTREKIESLTIKPGELSMGPGKALDKTEGMIRQIEESLAAANNTVNGRFSPKDKAIAQDSIAMLTPLLADYQSLRNEITPMIDTPSGGSNIRPEVSDRMKAYQ